MSNNVKNFAFSINHWLSDHILRAGDSLTCLFKLVQSIFLIYAFKNFISSIILTLYKQKLFDFGPFLQDSLTIAKGMVLEVFKNATMSKSLLLASTVDFLAKPSRLGTP